MILEEGKTCWRIAAADRATVLFDGSQYFAAARAAMLKAEHSILIVGWDVHGETDLLPDNDDPEDDAPTKLRPLLNHIAGRRPELRVRILLWDFAALYAFERELLPSLNWGLRTPAQVEVYLDDKLPLGGSHHQKLLVIDDAVAFSGGLDLTIRRWDTPDHEPGNPYRVDPAGEPYAPYHDVQIVVDGEAAAAISEVARKRWQDATGIEITTASTKADPWPDFVEPNFTDARIGISRTIPGLFDAPQVREIEALYLRAIETAERVIFIENQYFTSENIANALTKRLQENPELELLILGPSSAEGWFESRSMGFGRKRIVDLMKNSDVAERTRVLYPVRVSDGNDVPVYVHAKLMIIDDGYLQVGSANLNNRSMGVDTECDLAIAASTDTERGAIARVRARLLAIHTGSEVTSVLEALEQQDSIFTALEGLVSEGHALLPVEDDEVSSEDVAALSRHLADPDTPFESSDAAKSLYGAEALTASWKQRLLFTGLGLGLVAAVFAWSAGPLAQFADGDNLKSWLGVVQESNWTPVFVVGIYLFCSAVVFPVTVLIVATSTVFGPWLGFLYALGGCLISSAITFEVGALVGRSGLRKILGARLNKVSRTLGRQGVISVAIVRILPLAPFTFINLAAGVSHIRHRDFFLGTVFGMTPGLVIMSAMGGAIRRVWENPDFTGVSAVIGALGAWFAFGILVQRYVARRSRRQAGTA